MATVPMVSSRNFCPVTLVEGSTPVTLYRAPQEVMGVNCGHRGWAPDGISALVRRLTREFILSPSVFSPHVATERRQSPPSHEEGPPGTKSTGS